jgi:hypothetical protein
MYSLIAFLGKNPVVEALGNRVLPGIVAAVLASLALLTWEYIRLEPSGQHILYAVAARRTGVTLGVIAMIIIVCRFITVWAANGF